MPNPNLSLAFGLKPRAALDYFQQKGLLLNPTGWASVAAQAHAKAFTAARTSTVNVVAMLQKDLRRAIDEGESFDKFQKRLIPKLKAAGWWGKDPETGAQLGSPYRLATIFRTNVQVAYMEGLWRDAEENADFAPWVRYIAILDNRTRPAHRALHNKVFRWDDPFWQRMRPPLGWNCFLPNTKIQGDIEYGLESFYSGQAIEITTHHGLTLSITANHPILTMNGWVRADQITEGDNLISNIGDIHGVTSAPAMMHNEHSPTTAEQWFQSMRLNGLRVSQGTPLDLNKNFDVGKSDVYITAMNSELMAELDASFEQFIKDRYFKFTHYGRGFCDDLKRGGSSLSNPSRQIVNTDNPLNVSGAITKHRRHSLSREQRIFVEIANLPLQVIIPSSSGSPGATALTDDSFPVSFESRPLDHFSLGTPSNFDSATDEARLQSLPAASSYVRNLLHAFPGLIQLDQVIKVRNFRYSGHVYDFQTTTGVIFAQNILAHNCRCRFQSLSDIELERMGLKPETGDGNIITREVEVQGQKQPQAIYRDPQTGQELATDVGWGNNRVNVWTPDPADYPAALQPEVQAIEAGAKIAYQDAYDECIDVLIKMPMVGAGSSKDDIRDWLDELAKATQTDTVIAATLQAQSWIVNAPS